MGSALGASPGALISSSVLVLGVLGAWASAQAGLWRLSALAGRRVCTVIFFLTEALFTDL